MIKLSILLLFFPIISLACDCEGIPSGQGDIYHVSIDNAEYEIKDNYEIAKLTHERERVIQILKKRVNLIESSVNDERSFGEKIEQSLFEKDINDFNLIQNKLLELRSQPKVVTLPVLKTVRGPDKKTIRVVLSNGCKINLKLSSLYEFTVSKRNTGVVLNQCNTKEIRTPNKLKNLHSLSSSGRVKSARPF